MDTKKNMAYMITLLVISIIILIGGTYSYFTAGMSSGETEATLRVGAGQLRIKFANTNSVQIAENVQPTSANCGHEPGAYYCNQSEYTPVGTKTFTLTGTNTTDASKNMKMLYNIKLIIPQNGFSSGALKYTLIGSKEDSDNGKVVNIETWQDIPTGANTTGILLGSGYFMPGENAVHSYSFNIYFPDNHWSQDEDKNKTFSAKIEITTDEIEKENIIAAPNGWYSATENTLLGAIKRDNVVSEPLTTPGLEEPAENEKVLASTEDDYGTSYYFRGAVENNYVEYVNMCWRIVRVTGDGSIKLVLHNYNGFTYENRTPLSSTPCNVTGDDIAFARYGLDDDNYYSEFNESDNDNAYVGFMYGTPESNSYAETHANINSSTILTNLNKWYTRFLWAQYMEKEFADIIWCNDKSVVTDTTFNPYELDLGANFGYGTNTNYYGSLYRLESDSKIEGTRPSLICPNDNLGGKLSKFTVNDTVYGNGALSYPIGLLTADEVTFGRGAFSTSSNSDKWWTLSPYYFYGSATNLVASESGYLQEWSTIDAISIRPAIALVSSIKISSGDGTATNPYKVVS